MKKTILTLLFLLSFNLAFASGGAFEDTFADIMSWVVLIVLPIGGIYLFWQAHIYPEVVAEKNEHPQLQAIKIMCLLSLFVGGLLWPVALIWANYKYPEKDFPHDENQGSTTEDLVLADNSSQESVNPIEHNPTN